jgi:hypothetical protein
LRVRSSVSFAGQWRVEENGRSRSIEPGARSQSGDGSAFRNSATWSVADGHMAHHNKVDPVVARRSSIFKGQAEQGAVAAAMPFARRGAAVGRGGGVAVLPQLGTNTAANAAGEGGAEKVRGKLEQQQATGEQARSVSPSRRGSTPFRAALHDVPDAFADLSHETIAE